jgi:predicted nuclease of predicted toxin-antitoxin system
MSYRILKKVSDLAPLSIHVNNTDLRKPARDREIWEYARKNNFLLVTFDEDFQDLMNVYGFLPKIILLRMGNSSTSFIANELNAKSVKILAFNDSAAFGLLEIF